MSLRHKIVFAIAGASLGVLMLMIIFGDNGLMELRRLKAQHAALVAANERVGRLNLDMYRSIERLQNDPVYIEHIARRELGMVRSDELIFKFIDDTRKP